MEAAEAEAEAAALASLPQRPQLESAEEPSHNSAPYHVTLRSIFPFVIVNRAMASFHLVDQGSLVLVHKYWPWWSV